MALPAYWLPRPPLSFEPDILAELEALAQHVMTLDGAEITGELPAEKWKVLCYLADHRGLLLHGSSQPDLELFEPRQPNDSGLFSGQNAVYAASDGIWPMFFAIRNRSIPMRIINGCLRLERSPGVVDEPLYFFSISREALQRGPWQSGTVYLLPRQTFVHEPSEQVDGAPTIATQWASLQAVRPLAKLHVSPQDFPFLTKVRGHDDAEVDARAQTDPGGFPWLDC